LQLNLEQPASPSEGVRPKWCSVARLRGGDAVCHLDDSIRTDRERALDVPRQNQLPEHKMSGVVKRRIIETTAGAYGGSPGAAIVAEAEFDGERVVVRDTDGNEIARANVTPGDDPFVVARRLLPRPRGPAFWEGRQRSWVPY
jgi:hypothetical protein